MLTYRVLQRITTNSIVNLADLKALHAESSDLRIVSCAELRLPDFLLILFRAFDSTVHIV